MCGKYLEEDNIKITTSVHAYMPTLIVPKVVGGGGLEIFCRIDAKWCTLRTFGVENLPYSFCHFISQYLSVLYNLETSFKWDFMFIFRTAKIFCTDCHDF